MGNPQVTISQFELGWLVGVYDGEGCFSLSRNSHLGRAGTQTYTPGVKFVNTNLDIIEEVCRLLKLLEIPHFVYDCWRGPNQKPAKRIDVCGLMRAKRFLDLLFPYFDCRFAQINVLKKFVDHRLSKNIKDPYTDVEPQLYNRLRELNKQGP